MKRSRALELLAHSKPALAKRYGVVRLALFGSTARADSDIDILVAFDGPATSERYFGVQFYLEDLFGCPVDLVTDKAVRRNCAPSSKRKPCMSDVPPREWRFYVDDMIGFTLNAAQNQAAPPEAPMTFAASDVVPLTQARAKLSELADQAKAGAEKIIIKNGESCVALIDSERLDYYHRLVREHVHLLLLDDVDKGFADVAAGRTRDAREALADLTRAAKRSRAGAGSR